MEIFIEYLRPFICFLPPKRTTPPQSPSPRPTLVELRREKIRSLATFQTSRNYRRKRQAILNPIPVNYEAVLLVWPRGEVGGLRSLVSRYFHTFGKILFISDRFWLSENSVVFNKWRGAVVEYESKKDAMKACFDLPVQFNSIRAALLNDIISILADSELIHPLCRSETTKLVISRRIPLKVDEVADLYALLNRYGPIRTFFVNNRLSNLGVVCEVTYTYLTQAYLAMLMTDGQYFSGGLLRACIEKNQRVDDILSDASTYLVWLHQSYLPK